MVPIPTSQVPEARVIGISGHGGAGKSTYARRLAEVTGATVIGVDDFFARDPLPDEAWDCIDFDLIRSAILLPVRSGETRLRFESYEYGSAKRLPQDLDLTPVSGGDLCLIVEGVGLFRPEIVPLLDHKIWIDCPLELAIEQGKRRDRIEYGVDNDAMWDSVWRANEENYVQRFNPVDVANQVIPRDLFK